MKFVRFIGLAWVVWWAAACGPPELPAFADPPDPPDAGDEEDAGD